MNGNEEDLKAKLQELERSAFDPGLAARGDEIWARMMGIRERVKVIREEMVKRGGEGGEELDEITIKRSQKILEDYSIQLSHLRKELEGVAEDLTEWEKSQTPNKR